MNTKKEMTAVTADVKATTSPQAQYIPSPCERSLLTRILRDNLVVLIPLIYLISGLLVEKLFDIDNMIVLRWNQHWFVGFIHYFILSYFVCIIANCFLKKVKIYPFLRKNYLNIEAVFGFVLMYFIVFPFFSVFSSFKSTIPVFNPFSWDKTFSDIDRWLHFGHFPWEFLQPVLANQAIIKALDLLYMMWFYVLFAVCLWMAWSRYRRLRVQFFTTFFLSWIVLGTFMAIFFSSAGPCYYQEVVSGENPYRTLMSTLQGVVYGNNAHLIAIFNQKRLWEAFETGNRLMYGGGISAMPSLHVAIAVLFALVGLKSHPALGVLFIAYAYLIFIGSICLGWHYAIDGYIGALLTVLIWRFVDRFLEYYGWREQESQSNS